MKQKVNKDNWNRNKQFQFFSKFDSPYTGCTTLIDVDDLIKFSKKNKIYYDKLFINIDDKAKFLQKIKPDFYIDDSLKNCDSVEKMLPSTKIYLMNTKYNKNIKTNHIRINSIKDFYNLVKERDINER